MICRRAWIKRILKHLHWILFEDISYIMAKHADPAGVPDTPDEWLDQFGTFSIYQILPEIIELWGLNVQTQIESKKNFDRLTAK